VKPSRKKNIAILLFVALCARVPPRRSGHAAHVLACLFNHLGGAQQYRWGYREAKRRGGLAVHDHLEFGRKLHREIARLRAAQNAINIGGGATKEVYLVGSVGE